MAKSSAFSSSLVVNRSISLLPEQLRDSSMADIVYFLILIALLNPQSNSFAESRKELRDKAEFNGESVIQLRSSIPSNRMDPSRVVSLSWRPRVFLHEGFLTDEECDHLVSMAQAPKEEIAGNGDNSIQTAKKRMLAGKKLLSDVDDSIIARIEERISAWTLLPLVNSQPLQVTHYKVEDPATTQKNITYFSNHSLSSTFKHPLVATLVLYLSNVTRGGQILLTHSQEKSKIWSDCGKSSDILRPAKGKAILLFNLRLDGSPDPSSSHSRCPVQEGEMWVATKLFFVKPVTAGKLPIRRSSDRSSSSNNDECTDEDDNCQSWAANGECQRNPVYMIGSDDYFGTCRKSCKAC